MSAEQWWLVVKVGIVWGATLGAMLGLLLPGVLGVDLSASPGLRLLAVAGIAAVVLIEAMIVDRGTAPIAARAEKAEAEATQLRAAIEEMRDTLGRGFEDQVTALQLAHDRELGALRRGLEQQRGVVKSLTEQLARLRRAHDGFFNKQEGEHEG